MFGSSARDMSGKMWIVSAPNEGQRTAYDRMKDSLEKSASLCSVYKLELPEGLRVGTLDSLIAVADAAARDDRIVEATTDRVLRQYRELVGDSVKTPSIDNEDVTSYLQFFEWDDAKFSPEMGLSDIRQAIVDQVSRIEDDMKVHLADYTTTKQALNVLERRSQGNLMTRSLTTIVKADDDDESEYLTTLYVVMASFSVDEFMQTYETLCDLVVPRSARKIEKDSEYTIVAVTVFKKCVPEFKAACRDKRYTVREFTFDPNAQENADEEEAKLKVESDEQLETFTKWTESNYSEAFLAMVHLKAIRAFAESVLRYGLPVNFDVVLLAPQAKNDSKLRTQLNDMYSHLGGSWASQKDDESTNVPGVAPAEFYPYVYLELPLPVAL